MIIYKCDRCGKLIENMDDGCSENKYLNQKVFHPRYDILKRWDYLTARIPASKIHLCEDCEKDLDKFLDGKLVESLSDTNCVINNNPDHHVIG